MSRIDFFLKDVFFFQQLQHEDIKKISPLFSEKTYKKGTVIFFENEPGDEFFIVKEGIVKISKLEGAKEVILAIFHEGDYFGEMAVLEKDQVRSASAEAMETSVLYVLNRRDFMGLMEDNPKLTLMLLEVAMARIRKMNEMIKDLTTLDARTRIIKLISGLTEEYGCNMRGGVLIDLKLTHQQIADMTSTVRETVTKILLELQYQDIIQIEKKKIWIHDMNKLQDMRSGS